LTSFVDWFLSDYNNLRLSKLHDSFLPKMHDSFLPLIIPSLMVLGGFDGTRRLTVAPTRQFRKKKWPRGDT
jgi:hypothetical protein